MMFKKFGMFMFLGLFVRGFWQAADVACTMEYAPVCGQPPMPPCPEGMACAQVMPAPVTYGNACAMEAAWAELLYTGECAPTVIEENPIACTKEYAPVCGQVNIQCITTPCDPIQNTYGNRCMMEADWAEFLYTGECVQVDLQTCSSYYDGCNTCSVENGELVACTEMACLGDKNPPRCLAFVDEVRHNDTILFNADKMLFVQNIVQKVLSPWSVLSLLEQSSLYQTLLSAIDQKIADMDYLFQVAFFTPEGYTLQRTKYVLLQYVQFLLRNIVAGL